MINNRLPRLLPNSLLGRYVLVGLWNTAFGYSSFAVFTFLLEPLFAHGYLLAYFLSSLLNITAAFLAYKRFVFKTTGGYLREWCRCIGVYGGSMALNLTLLPILVVGLRKLGSVHSAPYLAGALLTGITALSSFFGHKHFAFRPGQTRN